MSIFSNIFVNLFLTFFKIGAFTFGGGYAMLPLIQGRRHPLRRQHPITKRKNSPTVSSRGVFSCQIFVVLRFFLLLQPGFDHKAMGQKLHSPHLHPHREAMDGIILPALI